MRIPTRCTTVLLASLLAACATAPAPETAKPDPKPDAKKARELEYARTELQAAELDAEGKLHLAELAVHKAEVELELARSALAALVERETPIQTEESSLALDRAKWRADEARDELAELEAMYKAEEFAKTTKELVLKRGRRALELSERDLGVQGRKQGLLREHSLPRRKVELELKVQSAEAELHKARLDLQKTRLETGLALRKARDKVADLEEQAAKQGAAGQ